jgi:hypothetical protein
LVNNGIDALNGLRIRSLWIRREQKIEERLPSRDRRRAEEIGGQRKYESGLAMGLNQDTVAGTQTVVRATSTRKRSNSRQAARARPEVMVLAGPEFPDDR